MPEYTPEYMSDRMSEYTKYMSKYTSWHVMVFFFSPSCLGVFLWLGFPFSRCSFHWVTWISINYFFYSLDFFLIGFSFHSVPWLGFPFTTFLWMGLMFCNNQDSLVMRCSTRKWSSEFEMMVDTRYVLGIVSFLRKKNIYFLQESLQPASRTNPHSALIGSSRLLNTSHQCGPSHAQ